MRERSKQPNYSSNNRLYKPPIQNNNQRSNSLDNNTNSNKSNNIINSNINSNDKMIKYKNLDDIPDELITSLSISNNSNDYNNVNNNITNYLSNQSINSSNYKPRLPSPIVALSSSNSSNNINKGFTNQLPDFPCNNLITKSNYINNNQIINQVVDKDLNTDYDDDELISIDSEEDNDNIDYINNYDDNNSQTNYQTKNLTTNTTKKPNYKSMDKSIGQLPALPSENNTSFQSQLNVKSIIPENEKLFFSKEPRKTEFKPYSLEQYRMIKPKEYIQISNLKPDLNTDELIAKRANLQRVKEFAKQLKKINDDTILQQDKLPSAKEQKEIEISKQKHQSKRTKALEFAKNIPKPKVKDNGIDNHIDIDNDSLDNDNNNKNNGYDNSYNDNNLLDDLKAKHLDKKKQIDAIKKSLGLK